MIREGATVAYTGAEQDGLVVGDRGRVLASNGVAYHVLWHSGVREHQVTAHYENDLVTFSARSEHGLEDSLEVGGLVTFSARQVFEIGGSSAVVSELAEMGHLAGFADIAEEALGLVAARVRQDPSVRAVTAALDEDEAEEVVRTASACLIRDAFGGEDDE